jgi:drug/metabolite transporter (DMT)-like permease
MIGTFIMFTGIFAIVTQNFSSGLSFNAGDILVFSSAFFYACGTVLFKRFMHHIPPEVIVTFRNLFGAVILFMLAFVMVDFSSVYSLVSLDMLLPLFGLVFLTVIGAQLLWYKALEMTYATNVLLATLSSPLIGVFYAVFLLGEPLLQSHVFGGALILAGLISMEIHFSRFHTPPRIKRRLKFRHIHHA